jgi:glycerol-3-phosphate dehydrogenase subunit B
MKRFDLIVIGTGLAGLSAARTAIGLGAKVLIAGRGMGALTLFGNSVDLLGEIPPGTQMAEGMTRWIAAHPEHPYARTGWEGIESAIAAFRELFPPPYHFAAAGPGNSLLPTGAGTMRPTWLIPVTMAAGAAMTPSQTLIVGFRGFRDFQGDTVSLHLKCRGVTLPLPRYGLEGLTASALARLMDQASFRERLGESIRQQMAGESFIGLPAVLGFRNPAAVLKTMENVTGARVFEIPMLPPSIPGTRIFHRFREELIAKGATFLMGHPVSGVAVKDGRCEGINIPNPPLVAEYRADQYILATGRFLGGGLWANMERMIEPVFDLPLFQPGERGHWFGERFFDPEAHPIHRAGVVTDPDLRPVDATGRVVLANVRAAGSILAHHRAIEEKSREGIDIATGYLAATRALAS